MIKTLEFKQTSHLSPSLTDPQTWKLTAGKLLGRWVNTNRESRGIAECVIDGDGEHVRVSIVGVGAGGPIKWPTTTAKVLANMEEEAGQRAVALAATFNFEFMRAETSIRLNRGVLVIVLYITFLDGSGRSSYVNREFFYSPS